MVVGRKEARRALFSGVAWGTDSVLATTRLRATEQGLRLAELPACWDLDRSEDLDRAVALGLVRLTAHP